MGRGLYNVLFILAFLICLSLVMIEVLIEIGVSAVIISMILSTEATAPGLSIGTVPDHVILLSTQSARPPRWLPVPVPSWLTASLLLISPFDRHSLKRLF